MKKLLKTNNFILFSTLLIFVLILGMIFVILNLKFEKTINAIVQVDQSNSSKLIFSSEYAYTIPRDNKLTIMINNNYYNCSILNMFFDEKNNKVIAEIFGMNNILIPGSIINVNIITEVSNVMNALFGNII